MKNIEKIEKNSEKIQQRKKERAAAAAAAVRKEVNALKYRGEDFKFTASFSGAKIKIEGDRKSMNFFDEQPVYGLLGLSQKIKKEVKEKIKDIDKLQILLKYLKVPNNYVYRTLEVDFLYNAWEYDLNMAYPSILHILFISEDTFKKLQKYKYEYNFNINIAVGEALLGEKITKKYKKGKTFDTIYKCNDLRPVFYLLRYLIINTLRSMLADAYKHIRISFFVDAVILSKKINIDNLINNFKWFFLESLFKLNGLLEKYENFNLSDIFKIDFNNLNFSELIGFKEKPVVNLSFGKEQSTGKYVLQFLRNGQLLTYK